MGVSLVVRQALAGCLAACRVAQPSSAAWTRF